MTRRRPKKTTKPAYQRDLVTIARVTKLEKLMSVMIDELEALKRPPSFAAHQRELGYRHSTSSTPSIIVKR